MAYDIVYDAGVLKLIERFPREIQTRIVSRIGMLSNDPRPPGSIKLTNENACRVRVGDY